MNRIIIFSLCVILLPVLSCTPKRPVSGPESAEPAKITAAQRAEKHFLEGEAFFQKRSYDRALSLFNQYLASLPEGPLADAALLKIGIIHRIMGQYTRAVSVLERLQANYPESPLIPEAKLEKMAALHEMHDFQKVVQTGKGILKTEFSRPHILRAYLIMGDAYRAMGNILDAASSYAMAMNIATETEQEGIIPKLKDIAATMTASDLKLLVDRLEGNPARSHLLFQLALNHANQEQLEAARTYLHRFIQQYPEHAYTPLARDLMAELNRKTRYSRHTLACMLPLTGRYRVFGNRALQGIELAFRDFSIDTPVADLSLIVKDTAGNDITAVQAAKDLADQRVAGIIGPIVTAEPVANVTQSNGIPTIVMTQKDGITQKGPYVFRNFITPQMQVNALVTHAIEQVGLKRFAILYPDEPYGKEFMQLFWDTVIEHRGKITGSEAYDPELTDFADSIKKLVGLFYPLPWHIRNQRHELLSAFDHLEENSGNVPDNENEVNLLEPTAIVDFDAIFIPDSPSKAGLILPQLAYHDIVNVYKLGTNLWHSEKIIEMAGEYLEKAIFPDAFFSKSPSPPVRAFVDSFSRIYGKPPGFMEAIAYDTARILLETATAPDINFRSTIRDRLAAVTHYDGVTGSTSFDHTGEAHKTLYLIEADGSHFKEIARNH